MKAKGMDKSENVKLRQASELDYENILQRIRGFQQYFDGFSKVFTTYTLKSSIVRDKTDDIAKTCIHYNTLEKSSTTTKLAMSVAAELIAKVGDHKTEAFQRVDDAVIPAFASFRKICESLKGDVRAAMNAHKVMISKKKVVKAFCKRMNGPQFQDINKDAEQEYENSVVQWEEFDLIVAEKLLEFEKKRLTDLKQNLELFFKIEMAKHAKALELFTESFKHMQGIDETADLDSLKVELNLKSFFPTKCMKSFKESSRKWAQKSSACNVSKKSSPSWSRNGTNKMASNPESGLENSDSENNTSVKKNSKSQESNLDARTKTSKAIQKQSSILEKTTERNPRPDTAPSGKIDLNHHVAHMAKYIRPKTARPSRSNKKLNNPPEDKATFIQVQNKLQGQQSLMTTPRKVTFKESKNTMDESSTAARSTLLRSNDFGNCTPEKFKRQSSIIISNSNNDTGGRNNHNRGSYSGTVRLS